MGVKASRIIIHGLYVKKFVIILKYRWPTKLSSIIFKVYRLDNAEQPEGMAASQSSFPVTHWAREIDSNLGFLGPKEITSLVLPKSEIVLSSVCVTVLFTKSTILKTFSPFASCLRNTEDSWAANSPVSGASGF